MSADLRAQVLAAVAAEASPTRAAVKRRNSRVGLLGAEAFDASGNLMKRFATGSIVKQGESYVLKDIKIRDMRTDAITELEFDP